MYINIFHGRDSQKQSFFGKHAPYIHKPSSDVNFKLSIAFTHDNGPTTNKTTVFCKKKM